MIAATSVLASCGDVRQEGEGLDTTGGPGHPSGSDGTGGDAHSGGDTDGGGTDTDGDDGGSVRFDVGAGDAGGEGGCDPDSDPDCSGCNSVDLLFIVDNSVSMDAYQDALGQAFPMFADAIIEVLPPATSLHVGVTSTTMGYSGFGGQSSCMSTGDDGQPASFFYQTPDTQPNDLPGAQGRLYPANGQPYFDIDTDAPASEVEELEDWFAAAANIGESGSQIEMASAPAGWFADPANDGTNAGFLRDEGAVLVLFFLQDEPDQTPNDASQEILDKITAAKSGCGGMNCVIGGGFVDQHCLPETPLGELFDAFSENPVNMELPSGGDVSADDFVPALKDTLAGVIAEKCQEIPPAG